MLPVHHLVDDFILLTAGTAQINPGGFQVFVAKQIGEERDISAFFDKAFGKTVAERMRMNHFWVHPLGKSHILELAPDSTGGNGVPIPV